MSREYRRNHYVPKWYQKRFLPRGQSHHYYLDLDPERVTDRSPTYTRKALLRWGPSRCFAQDDLYTTKWRGIENREIEKFFFGEVDSDGKKGVEHFANFEHNRETDTAFNALVPYMSVQKLRTPKGLKWLKSVLPSSDKNEILRKMQELCNIFCDVWGEAVWQIGDASRSATKFIISDHPVVAYNRECFPRSKWCIGHNDPDIRLVATHTYFPLSPEKILILTNLAWVRDPFQNPTNLRPNPSFFRTRGLFLVTDIQHERFFSEEEVLEINYVTKRRAYRYIAAAQEEWLYPERHLRSTKWRKLGDGYLFMPDPRHIHGERKMVVGFEGGRSAAWNDYGYEPWKQGYEDKDREDRERAAMNKFQTEWAATYGPNYRGVTYDGGSAGENVRYSMGEEIYKLECVRDREYLKQPGEKARRRRLKR